MTLKRKISEAGASCASLTRSSSLVNLGKVLKTEGDDQAITQRERHLALVSPARGSLQSNSLTPMRHKSAPPTFPISPFTLDAISEGPPPSPLSQAQLPHQQSPQHQQSQAHRPERNTPLSSSLSPVLESKTSSSSSSSSTSSSPSSLVLPPPLFPLPLLAASATPTEQPEILVGPIVGLVTDSTARVLLEMDRDCQVDCMLFEGTDLVQHKRESFSSCRPRVVQFSGLAPGTRYCVRFPKVKATFAPTKTGEVEDRVAYFRTFEKAMSEFRVVALACNDLECSHEGTFDLWHRLLTEYVLPDTIDLVLHLGDQVYADPAFEEGLALLARGEDSRLILLYQDYYRKTWNEPSVARVLARVQHLMQWDDHEIRNDWGSVDGDDGKGGSVSQAHYRVALAAREAYWLYQRQLWDDNPELQADVECHFHRWGKFGVLITDNRTSRTFGRKEGDKSYFSRPQWQALSNVLTATDRAQKESAESSDVSNTDSTQSSDNDLTSKRTNSNGCEDAKLSTFCASSAQGEYGFFDEVRSLLVVTTSPLVFLGTAESKYVLGLFPSLRDKLGSGLHPSEQVSLCRLLDGWKSRAPGRELLVVAGDLHFAVESTIFCNKSLGLPSPSPSAVSTPLSPSTPSAHRREMFRHIVTSPINNQPASQRVFQAWRNNCECCSKNTIVTDDNPLHQNLSFDHTRFIDNINFAYLTLTEGSISSTFVLPDLNYWDHHQVSRRRKD